LLNYRDNASVYHKRVGGVLEKLFPNYALMQEVPLYEGYKRNKELTTIDYRSKRLFVDWFIPDIRLAIEVDGEHHYQAIDYEDNIEKAEALLEKRQRYDKIKNNIMEEIGWKCIRIPYWKTENEAELKQFILDNIL
jgi:very-short-patch-repair endonuclease